MMKAALSKLALAGLLIAVSTQGFAQLGGGGMGGGRRGRNPEASGPERNPPAADPAAAAAGQLRDSLYDLRLQWAITPEQAPLWERFSDAVWALAGRKGLRPAAPPDDPTAVQAFRLKTAQAQERASHLQVVTEALAQLYAVLSPDQQRMADRSLAGALP